MLIKWMMIMRIKIYNILSLKLLLYYYVTKASIIIHQKKYNLFHFKQHSSYQYIYLQISINIFIFIEKNGFTKEFHV